MPLFVKGRLWVTPVVVSVVDDSAMYNKNLSVGNVCAIIGRSTSGKPLEALRIGSPAEAKMLLGGGELLKAVQLAFSPSSETGGPALVVAVRVNPAEQSKLTLLDNAGQPAIDLLSTDYGRQTNNIRVSVETGSIRGLRITTKVGESYYTGDNISRNCFNVVYTGYEDSATITVGSESVTLCAPAGTVVQEIDLNHFSTIAQLVDVINSVAGFDANIMDAMGNVKALYGLDFVTDQDVKTSYVCKGDLEAAIDWINSYAEGYVDATRADMAGAPPALTGWQFLTGGGDGVVTVDEWQKAFDVLQSEDVQWIVPLNSEGVVHAMADAHVKYMSDIGGRERRAIVGGPLGLTDEQVMDEAKMLNSDRTSLVHLGFYLPDETGAKEMVLYPPYMLAAMMAGAFTGLNPGNALTNKTLSVGGLERRLRNPTDTDVLIPAGVMCMEDTFAGYKVVKSVTTWRINSNFNKVEMSVGAALDFVVRNVRNILNPFKGKKANNSTATRAVEAARTTLQLLSQEEPMGPGVLVGTEKDPPFRNLTGWIDQDVLTIEFEASIVVPLNFVKVAVHTPIASITVT